jgi:signal transduction histidine kinase
VVRGDGLQLERVLLNLLSNAVKFTPAGGRVALDVAVGDRHVVLTCADTGIGIPAAEQQHLFDRFFRASNATEQAIPGTGLGLVVVRGIVERHGGSVDLASQHGRGTTATVRLPRRGTGTPGEPTAFSPSVRPLAHWPVGSGSRAPVRGRHDPATKDDEGAPP